MRAFQCIFIVITTIRRGGQRLSTARGRPVSDNPRKHNLIVRMTDADREALAQAAQKLGMKKSDLVRQGIEIMLQKAKEKE